MLLKAGEVKDIEYTVEVSEDINDIKNGKITSTEAVILSKSAVCNDIYVGYTFTDLDKALKLGLEMTLKLLKEQGREISPESAEALAFLERSGV